MSGRPSGPSRGQLAPDFELPDQHRQPVRLSSFRGKANVLLVFYPAAFTPTCTGELCALRDEGLGAPGIAPGDGPVDGLQVLGISCDPPAALKAFAGQYGITHPLLSDFWPHGEVARRYGVFVEERGIAARGSFLVDRAGVLRWSVVTAGEARDIAGYHKALAELG